MAANTLASGTSRPLARHPWVRLAVAVLSASLALVALLAMLGSPSGPSPALALGVTRYVATTGTDAGNNCSSSSAPCATVQRAVNMALQGDEILVAAGVYTGVTFNATSGSTQTVFINKDLALRGGFAAGDWSAADPAANPTVLDARGLGHVVYIAGSASPTVEGFVIRNGDVGSIANGGGVFVQSGSPVIARNVILNNAAFDGGGIYNNSGSPRLERNTIHNNTAVQSGGGFFSGGGSPTTHNNVFHHNTSNSNSGAIGNNISSTLVVRNDVFYANQATTGSGGGQGLGGALGNGGSLTLVNAIIAANTAANEGGGVYSFDIDGVTTIIDHSDLYNNAAPVGADYSGPGLSVTNSIFQDPRFVDAPGGDFHLQAGSPARDTGTQVVDVTDDIDGEARPFGSAYDMGVDEYYSTSTCFARLDNYRVYDSVQAAVNDASTGSLVQAAGYCAETVSVDTSLTLRGGYTVTNWLEPRFRTVLDAQGAGRAIEVTGAVDFTLENMHVTGGQIDGNGAGVYLGPGVDATLQNNAIYGNQTSGAGDGGGVYAGGGATLRHNTLYGNRAYRGGGVYSAAADGGTVVLNSNILAGNSAGDRGGGVDGSGFSLAYNDFYNNTPDDYGSASPGATDLSVPPGLVDPAAGDFHLDFSTSGVINRADPGSGLAGDFEGDARPQGSRADIGADESLWYADVGLSAAPQSPYIVTDTTLVRGKLITFSHVITNLSRTGEPSDAFEIQTWNSDGWPVSVAGISSPVILAVDEARAFQVVVAVPSDAAEPIHNRTLITATSQTNAAAMAAASDLIVNAAVQLLPSYTKPADPGTVITNVHTLKNTGPAPDTFTVSLASDRSPAWGALTVPWPFTTTLGPGESLQITAVVTVPLSAEFRLAEHLRLTAASNTYPNVSASVTDTTTANDTYGDRYVSTAGNDAVNNCRDLNLPCRTIRRGIEQASGGSTVFVARGTYNEHDLQIVKTILLQGGWSNDFTQRDLDPASTVIDAQSLGRVLQVTGAQPTVEFFTLQGGRTSGSGGGIYLESGASPTLRYNVIRNNRASTNGGGLYNGSGAPVLHDNQIHHNQADGSGGGLYNNVGTLVLSSTRLYNNIAAQRGGALGSGGGSLTVQNAFIYDNQAADGGAIYIGGGTAAILHDSLYANAASGNGGGIAVAGGTANIFNTIVFGHTGAGVYRGGGTVNHDYNDVAQNSGGDYVGLSPAPHSLSADPRFLDAPTGNLHLGLDSPAVDRGDPASSLRLDIDGDSRPVNQGFDIGADELTGCLAKVMSTGQVYGILQQAVDAAGSGDTVRVSGTCWGVHPYDAGGQVLSQTVHLVKPITLQGGWNSVFEELNPQVYTTTLDARGMGRAALISDTTAVLENFHVINGDASAAGGPDAGGGVFLVNAGATVRGNWIRDNAAAQGAGLYASGGGPVIERNRIYENQAAQAGGAVYNASADLMLRNNFVYTNTAGSQGGGVYNTAAAGTMLHNTLYGNQAGNAGGGLFNAAGAGLDVRSNVFASNAATGGPAVYDAGTVVFDYNDLWQNGAGDPTYSDSQGGPLPDLNNHFEDPRFVAAAAADFHLNAASPLVDAADPNTGLDEANGDFDGDPRPSNQGFDIGADEQAGCYASIAPYDAAHVYGSVQVAVDRAAPDGLIRVAGVCQGVHPLALGGATLQQTVHVTKDLALQGGWTWDPSGRVLINYDPLNLATLDALELGRVLLITDSATLAVENFRILNGDATGLGGGPGGQAAGGGVYNFDGALTLRNSTLLSNTAQLGGALYNAGGSLALNINSLHHNQAGSGAAVYLAGGSQALSFNSIFSNTAAAGGGGVYLGGGDAIILSANSLWGNSAGRGAALFNTANTGVTVQNSMVYGNQAGQQGGGFYNAAGGPLVQHNTFYANQAAAGGGLYLAAGSPVISNSLVVNNTNVGVHVAGGTPAIAFNDVYGNAVDNYGGIVGDLTGSGGNISEDPLFEDASAGNFHLRRESPAMDAGDPATTLNTDFEGDIRPSSHGFDMGADEVGNCFARVLGQSLIYGNPQAAIEASTRPTDTIDIAGECYGVHAIDLGGGPISQTIHLNESLTLRGGWRVESRGNPFAEYDPARFTTVLDALGGGRVLYLYGGVTIAPTISGFDVRNGEATRPGMTQGGGVYNDSNATLRNVAIYSSTAVHGGGFYNAGGVATLEADQYGTVVVANNRATDGAGVYVAAGSPRIWNAVVHDNTASGSGGGFYLAAGGLALVRNDTLYENIAAVQGGGMYVAGGSHDLHNLIVASNRADSGGGGIYVAGGAPTLAYNDVWSNTGGNYGNLPDQTGLNGNISANPLFVNLAAGDIHLGQDSPALDAGDPQSTEPGADFEGTLRPTHQRFDMGADEVGGCLARIERVPDIHYGSVQLAVDLALVTDTVEIAGRCLGVHPLDLGGGQVVSQNVHLDKDVTLEGGFTLDPPFVKDYPDTKTYLDADYQGRVLYIYDGAAPKIDTLDLVNGDAAGLGGGSAGEDAGGCVYIASGQPDFVGGNTIEACDADLGGGVYNQGSDFLMYNTALWDNTAREGAGFYNAGGSPELQNLLYLLNVAEEEGGGIYVAGGSPQLWHLTMVDNMAGGDGGAVYNAAAATPLIRSSIFYENVAMNSGGGLFGNGPVDVDYSDWYENQAVAITATRDSNVFTGTKSLALDPMFEAGRPFALSAASPLIDASETVTPPRLVDFELDVRPGIKGFDMGWDEVPSRKGFTFTPNYTREADPCEVFTLTHTLSNIGNLADSYTVTLLSQTPAWGNQLLPDDPLHLDLEGGQAADVHFQVQVPCDALGGTQNTSILHASARDAKPDAGVTDITIVRILHAIEIAPTRYGAALPGETVTYTHVVTNAGNVTDTFGVTLNPRYSTAQVSPATLSLGPGMTDTITVSVTINDWAAGGLTDIVGVVAFWPGNPEQYQAATADYTSIGYITGTRYVWVQGNDGDEGESEVKFNNCTDPLEQGACRTIQHAVDQALPGDEIRIAGGVYTDVVTATVGAQVVEQVLYLDKSVALRGGYNALNWAEPPAPFTYTTTLDGQAARRVVYVPAGYAPTLEYLGVTGGRAAAGAGLYNAGSDLALHGLMLHHNHAGEDGAGLFSAGGDLLLQDSAIYRNQADGDGAGLFVAAGTASLENNAFHANQAAGDGGAIYNAAGMGITNTILVTNSAGAGGALYNDGSASVASSDVAFNGASPYGGTPPAESGNRAVDPRFVDAAGDDYHLQSGSPMVNAGSFAVATRSDFEGDIRPQSFALDMGADERILQQRLLFYPDVYTDTMDGVDVVITHTLVNAGDLADTVTLAADSSLAWTVQFEPDLATPIALGPGERQSVVVTYTVPAGSDGQTNVTLITATSSLTPGVFAVVRDEVHVMAPAWAIDKSVTPSDAVLPGGYLTYTIAVTNVGQLPTSESFTITDVLPEHTNFVLATPPPDRTGSTVEWVVSESLAVGEARDFTLVVTVTRPLTDGTLIVNDAYAVTGGGAYAPAMGAPVSVVVQSLADLTATKTADASLVRPGDYLTYTIAVTNSGASLGLATGVTISDTLPAGTVPQSWGFVPPASGVVTRTGNLLEWQLAAPIPVGKSARVTATVRVASPLAAPASLVNTYAITGNNLVDGLNGTLATSLTSTNLITLAKTVHPTGVLPGGMVIYTITLTNSGDGIAQVSLSDLLDPNFSPSSFNTGVVVPGRTWDTPAGVATVVFTATAPIAQGTYYNQAVTATYGLTEATLSHVAPVTVRSCWVRLNDDPTVYDTVQAAVDASTQPDDVVKVSGYCAGVTNRAGVSQSVYLTKTLTIRGGYTTAFDEPPDPAANPSTLDADGLGRVFYVTGNVNPTLEGLRITGGDAIGQAGNQSGGGLYAVTATLTLSDSQLFNNTGFLGGGLYMSQGAVVLRGSHVTTNTADHGGGAYVLGSNAIVNSSFFSGNTAVDGGGGGLYLDTSAASLQGSTWMSNTASTNGGGLYLTGSSPVSLGGNTIRSNRATNGGGMYVYLSTVSLTESDLQGNMADAGGGVYLDSSAAVLEDNSITANAAEIDHGGGVYLRASDGAVLRGNVITSNTAQREGGGVYLVNTSAAVLSQNLVLSNIGQVGGGGISLLMSDAAFTNTVVADNQATVGSGLYLQGSSSRLWHTTFARNAGSNGVYARKYSDEGPSVYSSLALTNTIVATHTVGVEVEADGDNAATLNGTLWWDNGQNFLPSNTYIVATGNYTGAPAFEDPDAGDYHIRSGSAAIDRGVQAGVGVDLDDELRPVGAGPDLGADEFSAGLAIAKTPDLQVARYGQPVTFTITITNTGQVTITQVSVTDPAVADCGRPVPDLPGGEQAMHTYTCALAWVTGSFTNTATVQGMSPAGVVTGSDTARVDVVNPAILLAKTPHSPLVESGDPVTFTLGVTNTGNVTLTNVSVADLDVPGCARPLEDLGAGAGTSYTCRVEDVTAPLTNTAVASGTSLTLGVIVTDTDTAFVGIISPAIAIQKLPDSQFTVQNGTVIFTISVTNTGNITLTNVSVSDPLAGDCNRDFTQLGIGAAESYTCPLVGVTGDLTNTAIVTGLTPISSVVTDTDDAFVDVTGPAVQVEKLPDLQAISSGDPVTFTISLTNTGDVDLDLVVRDPLAPGCNRDRPAFTSGAAYTYTCGLASVAADLTNTVTVTGLLSGSPVATDTDSARVDVVALNIQLAKTPDSQVVARDGTATFTIGVTNTGDAALDLVTVEDPLAPGCNNSFGLAVGTGRTYTCTLSGLTEDMTNVAVVTGTVGGLAVTNTDTAFVDVITPSIAIAKTPDSQTVPRDGPVTFTISVTNTGDVTLDDVMVTDALVPGCERPLGSLAPGAGQTFPCSLPAATGHFTNTAIVSGTTPLGGVVTDSDDAVVNVSGAAIAIAKTPDVQTTSSGGTVTFTISLTSTGDVTLTNVIVSDALAPGCSRAVGGLDIGASTGYTCALAGVTNDLTNTAVVTATPLGGGPDVGDSDTAFVDVTGPAVEVVKAPAAQIVRYNAMATFDITVSNTGDTDLTDVSVTDAAVPLCDRLFASLLVGESRAYTCDLLNVTADFTNTAVVTGVPSGGGPDVGDTSIAVVDVISPAIAIAKTPGSQTILAGQGVTFTISVTNTGDSPLDDVAVTDILAPGCDRNLGRLDAGVSDTYTCSVSSLSDDQVNMAQVAGRPLAGPDVTDSDTAQVDVIHPQIQIDKAPATQVIAGGGTAAFTITVTNTGDVALNAVAVEDSLAPNCNRTYALPLGAGATDSYTCTLGGVAASFTNTAVVSGSSAVLGAVVSDTGAAAVVVQAPVAGLAATNDSPTPLGGTTTLTASVTAGTDVTFQWAFGDGAFGSGPILTHLYPSVGTYTALVTASNSVSLMTATTVVSITDVAIAGLSAANDSPTLIGNPTALTATITAGSNVTYAWAFGDGTFGAGSPVSHTYPAIGTYTAWVTASNSLGSLTATTVVSVTEGPPAFAVYLPLVMKNFTAPPPPAPRPDLVVTGFSVSPNGGGGYTVQATVRNQSSVPVAYGNNFYVNAYADPPEPFTGTQIPDQNLRAAVRWGVQGSWFGAGQSRTLTASCQVLAGNQLECSWYDGGLSRVYLNPGAQHRFYAWADPYDLNSADSVVGTVDESNEDNNYSSVVPVTITAVQASEAVPGAPSDSPGPQPTPTVTR